jgi:hypothetical protein
MMIAKMGANHPYFLNAENLLASQSLNRKHNATSHRGWQSRGHSDCNQVKRSIN